MAPGAEAEPGAGSSSSKAAMAASAVAGLEAKVAVLDAELAVRSSQVAALLANKQPHGQPNDRDEARGEGVGRQGGGGIGGGGVGGGGASAEAGAILAAALAGAEAKVAALHAAQHAAAQADHHHLGGDEGGAAEGFDFDGGGGLGSPMNRTFQLGTGQSRFDAMTAMSHVHRSLAQPSPQLSRRHHHRSHGHGHHHSPPDRLSAARRAGCRLLVAHASAFLRKPMGRALRRWRIALAAEAAPAARASSVASSSAEPLSAEAAASVRTEPTTPPPRPAPPAPASGPAPPPASAAVAQAGAGPAAARAAALRAARQAKHAALLDGALPHHQKASGGEAGLEEQEARWKRNAAARAAKAEADEVSVCVGGSCACARGTA